MVEQTIVFFKTQTEILLSIQKAAAKASRRLHRAGSRIFSIHKQLYEVTKRGLQQTKKYMSVPSWLQVACFTKTLVNPITQKFIKFNDEYEYY